MTLKPSITSDVTANTPSMRKAIGPKLTKQFSANLKVAKYAFVLKFPDGVVTGRAVSRPLTKIPMPHGPILLAGKHFTVEASEIARAEGCDIVSAHEYVLANPSREENFPSRSQLIIRLMPAVARGKLKSARQIGPNTVLTVTSSATS